MMVKLSDDISGTMPDLTFFIVIGQWNKKFQPEAKINIATRIFCTLENSLSIRSVSPFLHKGNETLQSIEFWNRNIHNKLEWEMNGTGIVFAETNKVYRKNDFIELMTDYFIAQLVGLKQ